MKSEAIISESMTTEEKIVAAAYRLFTQKGYAATKTRDIAVEAGINVALLNYYFRSKEKLFDIILESNIKQFILNIGVITDDRHTTLSKKFELFVASYVDMLIKQPDMPIFILSEIRSNPAKIFDKLRFDTIILNSYMNQQIKEEIEANRFIEINPMHIILNLLSLTVFPFVGSPIFKRIGGLTDQQFNVLMEERKRLVPKWVETFMKVH